VDKIFQGYKRLRIEYGEPEDSSFMPRLNKSGELVKYIELTRIYILPNNKDNHSFIGFYFGGCSWDEKTLCVSFFWTNSASNWRKKI